MKPHGNNNGAPGLQQNSRFMQQSPAYGCEIGMETTLSKVIGACQENIALH
jgi:hypothetical protein